MILGTVFFLLGAVAILPVFIVTMGHFEGTFLQRLESVINCYDGTLIGLGTLFLVSSLALLTTHLSNSSAGRREASNRIIQAELKVSEFRQDWINEIRKEMSEVIAAASEFSDSEIAIRRNFNEAMNEAQVSSDSDSANLEYQQKLGQSKTEIVRRLKALDAKIRMRLNPNQGDAKAVIQALVNLTNSVEMFSIDPNIVDNKIVRRREEFAELSIKYTKDEWDELKRRLKKARMLES